MTNETVDTDRTNREGRVIGFVLEPDGTLTPVVELNSQ